MKIIPSRSTSSTRIACFFLMVILVPAISPLSFLVPVANAQCSGGSCGTSSSASSAAGLASALAGGGSMQSMMMFMMLAMMMMQMFQGSGGSTPQTGTAEETAPQAGTVGPTNTGGNNNSGYSSGYSSTGSTGFASQSIFLAGTGAEQTVAPTTVTVSAGDGFNFFNTSEADQQVLVYKNGSTTPQVSKTVSAGNVEVFTFQNAGTYNVCLVNNGTESCTTTVTVQ